MARGLSPHRLSQLARNVDALPPDASFGSQSSIPEPFEDLRPRSIVARGSAVMVHLSGCFDDKTVLIVDRGGNGLREIVLIPGEVAQPEVLWQSSSLSP